MTYHNPVVGANGQRQAMFPENAAGVPARCSGVHFDLCRPTRYWRSRPSGCNAVTIDVALRAKALGMFVVALTSMPHAAVSTSKHESGA